MKKIITLTFAIIFFQPFCFTQSQLNFTVENFEKEIFNYQPSQKNGVSESIFSKGKSILENSLDQVKSDNYNFTSSDYWNISVAFIKLGEPKKHIELAFQKAIEKDPNTICEYLESFGEKSINHFRKHIPEVFNSFFSTCGNQEKVKKQKIESTDSELINLIKKIGDNDQKHRKFEGTDWSKQTPLDKRNLEMIDSLYSVHKKYLGKSLVGKENESIMWAVIQHSDIITMEKYLPILHQAVQEGELHDVPFKMLLDRIHCIKYNYQFFNSQFGRDCGEADPEKKVAIKKKYNLK